MIKEKVKAIWCDHCNAEIMPAGVRSCLRQTCATKAALTALRRGIELAGEVSA